MNRWHNSATAWCTPRWLFMPDRSSDSRRPSRLAAASKKDDGAVADSSASSTVRAVDVTSATMAESGSAGGTATLTKTRDEDVEALPPGRRAGNIAMSLMWLATAFLLMRRDRPGASAGRVPWGNMYEFSLSAALATAVLCSWQFPRGVIFVARVFVVGAILLTLGAAVTILCKERATCSGPEVGVARHPRARSDHLWRCIHHRCRSHSVVLWFAIERKSRLTAAPVTGWLSSRVPPAKRLDTMAYRINAFVFPLWTFAVIAGQSGRKRLGSLLGVGPEGDVGIHHLGHHAGYLHTRGHSWLAGRAKAAVICLVGYVAFPHQLRCELLRERSALIRGS